MGIKRGQDDRIYKGYHFVERERKRIRVGDVCAFFGAWKTVTLVRVLPDGVTFIGYSPDGLAGTYGLSRHTIRMQYPKDQFNGQANDLSRRRS